MIQDVDDALRTLVRREALPGDVDIAFEAPTKEWSSRRNAPTVDLYLYDIREDLQRREVMWQAIRDTETGFVTDRQPPPRYYKLSYLVTAWTQRPEDEHRLLSALLTCFIRHERLPDDALGGALVATPLPVFATIALPPPSDRPLSDVWSALGGELKPSLDLVIIAPLVDGREEVAGPPVREEPRISVVRPRANGPAGVGAEVEGQADADAGVEEAGGQAGGRRGRRGAGQVAQDGPAPQPSPASGGGSGQAASGGARHEGPLPDETIRSGTEAHPGRTVRLHVKRPPR